MEKINLVVKALKKINPNFVDVYDTKFESPFFDYIVVAVVDSVRQANSSMTYVKEFLTEEGFKIKSSTGLDSGWVLIDGIDILIHVFTTDEYDRVEIDKLYLDYKKVNIKD